MWKKKYLSKDELAGFDKYKVGVQLSEKRKSTQVQLKRLSFDMKSKILSSHLLQSPPFPWSASK